MKSTPSFQLTCFRRIQDLRPDLITFYLLLLGRPVTYPDFVKVVSIGVKKPPPVVVKLGHTLITLHNTQHVSSYISHLLHHTSARRFSVRPNIVFLVSSIIIFYQGSPTVVYTIHHPRDSSEYIRRQSIYSATEKLSRAYTFRAQSQCQSH